METKNQGPLACHWTTGRIRDAMRERGISFKKALNEVARDGLVRVGQTGAKRFVQKTYAMGAVEDVNWDKALSLAYATEDEELIRKMMLLK